MRNEWLSRILVCTSISLLPSDAFTEDETAVNSALTGAYLGQTRL